MSIEGQGHFFTIYFPGFVCFVLYYAKISGERLQDHWSSGLPYAKSRLPHNVAHQSITGRGSSVGSMSAWQAARIFDCWRTGKMFTC